MPTINDFWGLPYKQFRQGWNCRCAISLKSQPFIWNDFYLAINKIDGKHFRVYSSVILNDRVITCNN